MQNNKLKSKLMDQVKTITSKSFTATSKLFEYGIIDSIQVLNLITFIELDIGRKLADEEIILANLESIEAIVNKFGATQ